MSSRPIPLVLDLDDTLVRTDTLLEQLLLIVFRSPQRLLRVLGALFRGRAAFKRVVAEEAQLDVGALPYHAPLLELAEAHRREGGAVHLVTAADQSVATAVAAHLGVFDSARGSDGVDNVKGRVKAQVLAERFAEGFSYAGDSKADVHIWRTAQEIILVGDRSSVRRKLKSAGLEPHRVFPRGPSGLRAWARALRVHQWAKNSIVLVPFLLAQQFRDPEAVVVALLGWLAFNFVASATYILNDLSDLAADRAHPTKRNRPLAAGVISIRAAAPVAALLLFGGLALGTITHLSFGVILTAYVVLTLLYSFRLKAIPLIDVMTIGGLFAIRVVAGMVLIDAPISLWLATFTFMLFTSLALAKRNAELVRAQQAGRTVAGRGYLAGDTAITLPLGISTGVTSIVLMVLYMALEAQETGLYSQVEILFLIPVVLAAWILRIWLRSHRGELQDDPVVFALKDKVSWWHAAAVAGLWLIATAFLIK